MNVRGFLPSSFNEWEGRIAAVVFTGGCNWRCAYCHGARLVRDFASLPEVPAEEIVSTLADRKDWVDGVVVTGGEPTLQPDLENFLRELKNLGFALKLSTNGSHPEVVERVLAADLLECLGFDYKAPLDQRLAELTGVGLEIGGGFVESVKRSFALARAATVAEVEFHTTLCPTFVDAAAIHEMGAALQLPRALWVLQQYENDVEMLDAARAGTARYSREQLEEIAAAARAEHPRVLLRRGK